MIAAFPHAMPVEGLLGGLLIGLSAAIMLLGNGRIAGVSGLAARATGLGTGSAPRGMAAAFIIGLPLGAAVMALLLGGVEIRLAYQRGCAAGGEGFAFGRQRCG